MTIALALSVIVLVVGFCFYWWAVNEKKKELGRIMFFCGLFVSLLRIGGGLVLNVFKN